MSDLFHPLLYLSDLNVIYCDTGMVSSRRHSIPGTCDAAETSHLCLPLCASQHSADTGEEKAE